MRKPPEYTDGFFSLYEIREVPDAGSPDFPIEKVAPVQLDLWYREIAVYDRTRNELGANGIEITKKVRIPRYKEITSRNIGIMDGQQHEIYNVAHVVSKEGFPETEITFKTPRIERDFV